MTWQRRRSHQCLASARSATACAPESGLDVHAESVLTRDQARAGTLLMQHEAVRREERRQVTDDGFDVLVLEIGLPKEQRHPCSGSAAQCRKRPARGAESVEAHSSRCSWRYDHELAPRHGSQRDERRQHACVHCAAPVLPASTRFVDTHTTNRPRSQFRFGSCLRAVQVSTAYAPRPLCLALVQQVWQSSGHRGYSFDVSWNVFGQCLRALQDRRDVL